MRIAIPIFVATSQSRIVMSQIFAPTGIIPDRPTVPVAISNSPVSGFSAVEEEIEDSDRFPSWVR